MFVVFLDILDILLENIEESIYFLRIVWLIFMYYMLMCIIEKIRNLRFYLRFLFIMGDILFIFLLV